MVNVQYRQQLKSMERKTLKKLSQCINRTEEKMKSINKQLIFMWLCETVSADK